MYMNSDIPANQKGMVCMTSWINGMVENVCVALSAFLFLLNLMKWVCHLPFLLQGGAIFERRSFVCDITNSCGGPIEKAVPCGQSVWDFGIQCSQVIITIMIVTLEFD